jgi:hypothetical protein
MTEPLGGNDTEAYRYFVQPTDFSDWAGLHRLLHECFAFMEGRIDPRPRSPA